MERLEAYWVGDWQQSGSTPWAEPAVGGSLAALRSLGEVGAAITTTNAPGRPAGTPGEQSLQNREAERGPAGGPDDPGGQPGGRRPGSGSRTLRRTATAGG